MIDLEAGRVSILAEESSQHVHRLARFLYILARNYVPFGEITQSAIDNVALCDKDEKYGDADWVITGGNIYKYFLSISEDILNGNIPKGTIEATKQSLKMNSNN